MSYLCARVALTFTVAYLCAINVSRSANSSPELCDLSLWYLDLVTDGVFDGDLRPDQQAIKTRIENLIARTRDAPQAGRISCSTLTTFENILLPDGVRRTTNEVEDGGKFVNIDAAVSTEKTQQNSIREETEANTEIHGQADITEKPWTPQTNGEADVPEKEKQTDTEEKTIHTDGNVDEVGIQDKTDTKKAEYENSHSEGNTRMPMNREDGGKVDRGMPDNLGDGSNETYLDETELAELYDETLPDNSARSQTEDEHSGHVEQPVSESISDDVVISEMRDKSLRKSSKENPRTRPKRKQDMNGLVCPTDMNSCHVFEHLFVLSFQPTSKSVRKVKSSYKNIWALCGQCVASKTTLSTTSFCILYDIVRSNTMGTAVFAPPSKEITQRHHGAQSSCSLRCYYISEQRQCIPHYHLPNHTKDTSTSLSRQITRDTDQDDSTSDFTPFSENLRHEVVYSDLEVKGEDKDGTEDKMQVFTDADADADAASHRINRKNGNEDLGPDEDGKQHTESIEDIPSRDMENQSTKDDHIHSTEDKNGQREDIETYRQKNENNHSTKTEGGLTEAELRNLEFFLDKRAAEQAARIQALEITIMKLENHVLNQKLHEQGESTNLVHLENQILRLENELLRLNQSYAHLHADNELLKSRQNKYLALEHKSSAGEGGLNSSADPSNSSKYFELVSTQQERLTLLSDLLRNQSLSLQLLQARSDKLEEHNHLLHQIVMNQTALIAHVMEKLQEVSEQNLNNRHETYQLRSRVEFQSASDTIIKKLEHVLLEASPRADKLIGVILLFDVSLTF